MEGLPAAVQQKDTARGGVGAGVAIHALVRTVVVAARQHVHRALVVVEYYIYYILWSIMLTEKLTFCTSIFEECLL